MPTADLRRLRAVTDNFFFWQGLRWIPLGVALIIVSLSFSQGLALPKPIRTWGTVPILLVALWLSTTVLGRYYARTFGRVQMDLDRHKVRTSVKWFFVYPAMVGSMILDGKLSPTIVVSALVFAGAVEAYRESTGGGRLHYSFAAVCLVAFALLPLFGVIQPGVPAVRVLIGLLGAIYLIGGILDHKELVEIFGPQVLETDVRAL